MKKMHASLITLLLFFLYTSIFVSASNYGEIPAIFKPISIQKDLTSHRTNAVFYQGRIYIPIRFAAEILNISVDWDHHKQVVYLKDQNQFKDFPEADPWQGERFVYGEITAIDKANFTLTIEEHIDDNSIHIEPRINVAEDVVIILQRNNKMMNLDFTDLRVGENIGLVINSNGYARGIILNG